MLPALWTSENHPLDFPKTLICITLDFKARTRSTPVAHMPRHERCRGHRNARNGFGPCCTAGSILVIGTQASLQNFGSARHAETVDKIYGPHERKYFLRFEIAFVNDRGRSKEFDYPNDVDQGRCLER